MSDDLQTLAVFNTPGEAYLAGYLLEAEEISFYVEDSLVNVNLWYIGPALGGVKLKVARSDYKRAAQILADRKQTDIPEALWQTDATPETPTIEASPESEPVAPRKELHEQVRRVFQSSVFGIYIPVASAYSVWTMGNILPQYASLTGPDRWLLWLAGFFNLVVLLFWLSFTQLTPG